MTANPARNPTGTNVPVNPADELAQLQDALHRLRLMQAARISFYQALERAFNWPVDKPIKPNQAQKFDKRGRRTKYNRAPQKWKGRHGYELVAGIMEIQARDNCTTAAAVRELKDNEPAKWPEPERDLQRRHQEIKKYWEPWCRVEMKLAADIENLLAETELM